MGGGRVLSQSKRVLATPQAHAAAVAPLGVLLAAETHARRAMAAERGGMSGEARGGWAEVMS